MIKTVFIMLAVVGLSACASKPKPTPLVLREQVLIPVVIDDAMFICPVKPVTPTKKKLGRSVTDADVAIFIFDLSKAYDTCAKSSATVQSEMKKQAQIILSTSPSGLSVSPTLPVTGAGQTINTVNVTVVQSDGTKTYTGVTTTNP